MNEKKTSKFIKLMINNWILLLIILFSLAIRIYSVKTNLPYLYWHDENNFVETALRFGSGNLEPHGLRHGTLLSFILLFGYGIYYLFLRVLGIVHSLDSFALEYIINPTNFYIIGRTIVALFGTGVVYLAYLIGKRLYNKRVGILSALFVGFSFMQVNTSIIIKADIPATFLILLAYLFSLNILLSKKNTKWKSLYYILTGLSIGLATAAKYTSSLSYIFFLLTHILSFPKTMNKSMKHILAYIFDKKFVTGSLFVLFGFFIGEPIAFINPKLFIQELIFLYTRIIGMSEHLNSWTFILIESLKNSVGLYLEICILVAVIFTIIRPSIKSLILISYPLILLIIVSLSRSYTYYITPAIPFLLILAAFLIDTTLCYWQKKKFFPFVATILGIFIMLPSSLNSLRLVSLLQAPDTRTISKNWIEQNIPSGSVIMTEGAVNNQIVLAPQLNEDIHTLKEDIANIPSEATKVPLNLRLKYTRENCSLMKTYRLLKFKFLQLEHIEKFKPKYIILSGYFDKNLIQNEISGTSFWLCQKRQKAIAELNKSYKKIKKFEPFPKLTLFFPILLRKDFESLAQISIVNKRDKLFQGPKIEIYERK